MNNLSKHTLVIIAGGKSSRMKTDKALLPFGGYNTLSEYQYQKFKDYFNHIYISSKVNKFTFDVDIIMDTSTVSSPLVALISIFEVLECNEVMIISVDAPFISLEVCEKLFEESSGKKTVVAKSPNGLEPMCAVYNKNILPIAKEMLANNRHKLQELLALVKAKEVYFDNKNLFTNMNYPFEFEVAIKLFSNI